MTDSKTELGRACVATVGGDSSDGTAVKPNWVCGTAVKPNYKWSSDGTAVKPNWVCGTAVKPNYKGLATERR